MSSRWGKDESEGYREVLVHKCVLGHIDGEALGARRPLSHPSSSQYQVQFAQPSAEPYLYIGMGLHEAQKCYIASTRQGGF